MNSILYKIYVHDRNYTKWSLHETANFQPVTIENFNPTMYKLFSNDVFSIDTNNPDDMRLPAFLVPYEIKNVGFSKVFVNLYATFSFVDWNDKHPHGILTNVIGSVDVLDNFYEYQLHCKSLNA